MKKTVVWLASYPKSGNTWFRAFLSALQHEAVDINALQSAPMASSRILFEKHTGLDSSGLAPDEIDRLRPDVYRRFSETCGDRAYVKAHDACVRNDAGEWIFPPEATAAVIYLVRNPLDVALSFASHRAVSISQAVRDLCDPAFCLSPARMGLPGQLRQQLLDWSGHVCSWLDAPLPVCLVRYEDLQVDPFATFKRAADFLMLERSDAEIRAAIEQSAFGRLQAQEVENIFKGKPQNCTAFFRKGIVGEWRERLAPEYVEKLVDGHRKLMRELGYLDKTIM